MHVNVGCASINIVHRCQVYARTTRESPRNANLKKRLLCALTVGVGTDEDSDASARGDVERRERKDVPADGRSAQGRITGTGLPAAHSRRPHGWRLPARLQTEKRIQRAYKYSIIHE